MHPPDGERRSGANRDTSAPCGGVGVPFGSPGCGTAPVTHRVDPGRHCYPDPAGQGDLGAAVEHLVVEALDLVDDAAVEDERRLDAGAAGRVAAARCPGGPAPRAGVRARSRRRAARAPGRRRRGARGRRGSGRTGPGPPAAGRPGRGRGPRRRRGRSWPAGRRRRGPARAAYARGVERLEDRDHLQADDGGRPVHVAEQVVPRRVLGDGEVHRHRRAGTPRSARPGCPSAAPCRRRRAPTGSSLAPVRTSARNCSPQRDEPVGLLRGRQRRGQVVDDLVGVAGEAVQRVHVRPLRRRQQAGSRGSRSGRARR